VAELKFIHFPFSLFNMLWNGTIIFLFYPRLV
jgi:hypothetical protein